MSLQQQNPIHDVHNHVFDLHVYPTYAVKIPQRERFRPGPEALAKANEARRAAIQAKKDFEESTGETPPVLSRKAQKRLINSVNWLVASAKEKRVFSKTSEKSFTFKVNFITLTLPTTDHGISDHFFKSTLLHAFINNCRASHNLRNFVWKVEAQENGNIHAHFTTDTFIHHEEVRRIWNKILSSHGIVRKYTEKHARMTKEEYVSMYTSEKGRSIEQLEKAFEVGQKQAWTNPNTTDVHAVHKVKDISAYMAKYMSKNEADRRRISGRVWSCNYALSAKNKLIVECYSTRGMSIIDELQDDSIKQKVIESVSKKTGSVMRVGVLYLFKQNHWGTVIKGELLKEYNEFRWKIRRSITNVIQLTDQAFESQVNRSPEESFEFILPVKTNQENFYGKTTQLFSELV